MNATTALQAVTATHPCECGRFEVEQADGSWKRIPCGGVTKRVFAPGHDARLKGHLIRAEVAGLKVRRTGGGNNPTQTALAWAKSFGFGYQVSVGVALAQAKAAAKKAPKIAKVVEGDIVEPFEVEVPEEELAEVPADPQAKIGRWTYPGCLEGNEFVYRNAKGEELRTTKFTLI